MNTSLFCDRLLVVLVPFLTDRREHSAVGLEREEKKPQDSWERCPSPALLRSFALAVGSTKSNKHSNRQPHGSTARTWRTDLRLQPKLIPRLYECLLFNSRNFVMTRTLTTTLTNSPNLSMFKRPFASRY